MKNFDLTTVAAQLWNDERGFILSAELVLIATIVVLTLTVGLSEVSFSVHKELTDVARSFEATSQDGGRYSSGGGSSSGSGEIQYGG
ncbi:MAG: branched-chain amino acid aminotransferase [Planctomycetaceae bacterium]|nr:branched-chain amino acid aminotransferase [Planctomycetaceae bacterium]